MRLEDLRREVQVNGIGQNSQGFFCKFGVSCPAQYIDDILPGTLHRVAQLPLA